MHKNFKPAALPTLIPYLVVPDADKELTFMKEVFGAKEMRLSRTAQGHVGHAELGIGDAVVMLAQASDEWPPTPAAIYVYVPDVDFAYAKAIAAGGTPIWPPVDQPYGDRNAGVKDANDVQWWLATHKEDVSEDEADQRVKDSGSKSVPVTI